MRYWALFLIAVFPFCSFAVLEPSSLSVEVENDMFQGSDRDYTHGTRITFGLPSKEAPDWMTSDGASSIFHDVGEFDYGLVIGQNIFTPSDITVQELMPNDRPYAGYLYLGVLAGQRRGDRTTFVEVDVGVVGPLSMAEEAQTTIHEWRDDPMPQGWDNQLHNEPTLQFQYWESKNVQIVGSSDGLGIDMIPRVGGLLGNVQVSAAVGADVRLGWALPYTYGPNIITPTSHLSDRMRNKSGNYAYVFFGSEARACAWNIFLDGNTDGDSHSVEKEPLVSDIRYGGAVGIWRLEFVLSIITRSEEYKTQEEPHKYSALNVVYRF